MLNAGSAKRPLVQAQFPDQPEVGETGVDRLFLGSVEGEDLIDLVKVPGRDGPGDKTVIEIWQEEVQSSSSSIFETTISFMRTLFYLFAML